MCFLSADSKVNNFLYTKSHNIGHIKNVIEAIFMAPHGSAFSYNKDTKEIILAEPECDIKLFNPYFKGLYLFKKYWNIMTKYFKIEINYNNLNNVINNFHNNIDYQIEIKKYIKSIFNHVETHTDIYSKFPLKFYSQINQDKYYIQNIIKYKQEWNIFRNRWL